MKVLSFICSFLLLVGFASVQAEISSEVVAKIGKEVITSRRVMADIILEVVSAKIKTEFKTAAIQGDFFQDELNRYLIERAVYLESKNFSLTNVTAAEVSAAKKKMVVKILAHPVASVKWKELGLSNGEIEDLVRQRLSAQKFIEFKSRSSYVPVTEAEANNYFHNNRSQFTKEYKDIKESIKKTLAKNQAEERLRDWYDILKKKYDIVKITPYG